MEKTILIPEDYAGATIAQRTDRQWTLPFDFLNLQFPQIAIPGIREIRVSTHVNFEIKSDFIVEFAKNAVRPINKLNTDFKMPSKLAPDVNISNPSNINLTPRGALDHTSDAIIASLHKDIEKEIASLRENPDEMMDVDTFTPYLRRQLALAGLDARSFDKSIEKARKESDDLTEHMKEESTKSFHLIRNYLKSQEAETRELEKMLDHMIHTDDLLSQWDLPFARFISSRVSQSDRALDAFQTHVISRQEASVAKPSESIAWDRKIASIRWQLGRLIAANGPSPSPSPNPVAAGYSPKYEGIFILTPVSGSQTRLFDYTDLLSPNDHAEVVDIDKDGDEDYIFLLGWSLYVKYAHRVDPSRAKDTDVTISALDLSLMPRAPNFFHELVSSPGQIELSFAPAHPADGDFRLEFFDRYLEWDKRALSWNDDPNSPRTVVDMTVSEEPTATSDFSSSPVRRSLENVSSPGGFILEGMKVSTLTSSQPFSLSAGRAVYTGNARVTLEYTLPWVDTPKTLSLEKFERYTFPMDLSGSIRNGKLYVLNSAGSEKLSYTDDMIGMPLLPGTRLYHPNGSIVIYDPLTKRSDAILPNTEYRHLDLGKISTEYNVAFPFANGFYSARMRSLIDDRNIHAWVTLLAPQASLDRSNPVINIPGKLKVPVYQKLSLSRSDIITDMSSYTLGIDPDVTTDADGNWIFEDDFVTSASGMNITPTDIIFGTYDTLGTRMVNMQVIDAYGNTTVEEVEIDVYAPIPQIQSISATGSLRWALDAEIPVEPVHIFRVREGEGIRMIASPPTFTDGAWLFSLSGLLSSTGVILSTSLGVINISEKTGLPLWNTNLIATFIPTTASGVMQIGFTDLSNTPLFTYDIIPPIWLRIVSGNSGPIPEADTALMISPESNYSSINASLSDPSIPGGVYIVGSDTKAVLAVDIHGQIYSIDPRMTFFPEEKDGYLNIRAMSGATPIANLLYHTNFFLTTK
jgi:hypothetical protein